MYRKIIVGVFAALALVCAAASVDAAPVPTRDVPTYENQALKDLPAKDAIVIVSYGAADKTVREQSILSVTAAIQKVAPKRKVVTAFTNRTVIDRIRAAESVTFPTPEEAIAQLVAEGYTRVALVPLSLIADEGYERCLKIFDANKTKLKKMTCALPLMYHQGQNNLPDDVFGTIDAVSGQFPRQQKKEAIVLTANGTNKPSQAYYALMQDKFDDAGYNSIFVATLKGYPTLEAVIGKMKAAKIKSVVLMPFMLTAGDHAAKYVTGDGEQAQKAKLAAAGFTVSAYEHGLGENAAVRNLFVKRADEAWSVLRQK